MLAMPASYESMLSSDGAAQVQGILLPRPIHWSETQQQQQGQQEQRGLSLAPPPG